MPAVEFLTDNLLLIVLALTSGGMLLWQSTGGDAVGGGKVSPSEAVRLINREKAVLVDVGEPAEYASGHAAGARNVPLATLDGAKGLPTNKALPVVIMCPSGVRATRAAATLRKLGYERAVVLAGGLNAWREASLPVEKSA